MHKLQNQEDPYLELMEIWKFGLESMQKPDEIEYIQCEERTEIFLRRIDWLGVQKTHFPFFLDI